VTNPTSPGRIARDTQLIRALGILAAAGLLGLVAGTLHTASPFDETGIPDVESVAGWIEVGAFLPWLAALVLALDAFRAEGGRRVGRLRQAAVLAAASFALEAGGGLLTLTVLEAPLPRGYRVALEASILSSCGLVAAALFAARAFAPGKSPTDRERGLARALVAVAAGYGFGMVSAIYYAIAYANYPGSDIFVQGLKNQAFGALVVAVAAAWAGSAFRRSARAAAPEAASFDRERILFRAACALALAFLIICLGEVLIASGTTRIGYSPTVESARWVGVAAGLASVAAIGCAAAGFRRAGRA
jgi:hypothetical protein